MWRRRSRSWWVVVSRQPTTAAPTTPQTRGDGAQQRLVGRAEDEAVDEGDRPQGVAEPVDGLPRPRREPVPQEGRGEDGDEDVDGQGAEADEERLVGRGEGHDGRDEVDRDVGLGDGRRDVREEEHDHPEGEPAVGRHDDGRAVAGRADGARRSTIPRTTTDVMRTMLTMPVARREYQSSSFVMTGPPRVGASWGAGQPATRWTVPSTRVEAGRDAVLREPRRRLGAEDDGRGRGGVRLEGARARRR